MAPYSNPLPEDAGRKESVRSVRRTLPTARRAGEPVPPRVVLHLPDLDALSAVALGPPKPASYRRLDAAHPTTSQRHAPRKTRDEPEPSAAAADVGPTLTSLLKEPLRKFVPSLTADPESIGRWILLLQQPKVLLAAVLAVGLQLAAVLAMITGQKEPAPATSPAAHEVAERGGLPSLGGRQVDLGRTIQTPVSAVPGTLPADAPLTLNTPWSQSAGSRSTGPIVVAQPAPPAPLLPNLDMREVPSFPVAGVPVETPSADAATATQSTPPNLPNLAGPVSPANVAPPGSPQFPALVDSPGDARRSTPALPVGVTTQRAKLRGTIKKSTAAENTP